MARTAANFFVGLAIIAAVTVLLAWSRPPTKAAGGRQQPASEQPVAAGAVKKNSDLLTSKVAFMRLETGDLLLAAEGHERPYLAMRIPPATCQSIEAALRNEPLVRPSAHDLFVEALGRAGIAIEAADVVELRGDTFIAILRLGCAGRHIELDSRPSDAIAIALRAGAPLRIHRRVLDGSGFAMPQSPAEGAEGELPEGILGGTSRDM